MSPFIKQLFEEYPCKLLSACNSAHDFPKGGLSIPEIAFAGRSNVGKSSLLKAIVEKIQHVPTDNRPGTTRSLDFYDIARKLRIVDLPGYGFAFARDELLESWRRLIETYLAERRSLKRVMLIVDARHGLKKNDLEFLDKVEYYKRRFQIVLTKADLLEPEPLALMASDTKNQLKEYRHAHPELMLCSSMNHGGILEIRSMLGALIPRKDNDSKLKFKKSGEQGGRSSGVTRSDSERETLRQRIQARRKRMASRNSRKNKRA
eukprot:CAMPEP_0184484128 /NCGR_PEP_ID=MMETSP0113_2-20130426/5838_1 /TAXON_ID=91329 /ORGANISM="Norrisiella sphaerica, Strain BC52" /LENGTH=261 /DNA_ID=CAMNT_0026864951 /DNA_START=153 /DNA_END=938 /DNA_ORIENTATION=+